MIKRLLFIVTALLIGLSSFAQPRPKTVHHVPDSTTAFNISLGAGSTIFDEGSNRWWKLTAFALSTADLSTSSKILIVEAGSAADLATVLSTGNLSGGTDVLMGTAATKFGATNLVSLQEDGGGGFEMANNSGAGSSFNFIIQNGTTNGKFGLGFIYAAFEQTGLLNTGKILLKFGAQDPSIIFESDPASGGFNHEIISTTPTVNRLATLQDASGTLAYLADIPAADGNGIYTGSGSLTGATTVTMGANDLSFTPTTGIINLGGIGKTVKLNGITYPLFDGATNQVLTTDGGQVATFQNPQNLFNNNGTLIANRTVTMSAFSLTFSGNESIFKGIGTTSATSLFSGINSASANVLEMLNDQTVVVGAYSGAKGNRTTLMVNGNASNTQTNAIGLHVKGNIDNGTTSDIVRIEQTSAGGSPKTENSLLKVIGGFSVSGVNTGLQISQHPYAAIGTDVQNLIQLKVDHIYRNYASAGSGTVTGQFNNTVSRTAAGLTTKKGIVINSTGTWDDNVTSNSKNTGLEVNVSGGNNNYAGIFSGGQIGVGTTAPHPSALMELNSNTQGFRLPNMTNTNRDAIVSPDDILMIGSTTTGSPQYYNSILSTWKDLKARQYNFSYGSDAKPYLKGKLATYEFLASFFFAGTDEAGTPTIAKIIATNKGSITSNVRIYDVTNAQVIAEVTGFDPTVEEVFEAVDMGSLSNLPTGEAIFELQLLVSSAAGGNETWVSSLTIK